MAASCSTPRFPSPLCPQSLRLDCVQTLSQPFLSLAHFILMVLYRGGRVVPKPSNTKAFSFIQSSWPSLLNSLKMLDLSCTKMEIKMK